MTRRWSRCPLASPRAFGALALAAALGLAACTAAGPPKPPPPPIQESGRELAPLVATAGVAARPPGAPTGGATAVAVPTAAPLPPPTLPPAVAQAVAAPPPPPTGLEDGELPSARELATGMIAALGKAQTARLSARLPNQHSTDLVFVAPDRASLVEHDVNGQEYARYVIIGDTGYSNQASAGGGWRKVTNDGYRKQSQIFRPMQIALATGQPRVLESGQAVEIVDENGKMALHAVYEYSSSPELQELGLMRSGANVLEVVVDPATWLPLRTREETQGAVTEVIFMDFDQPLAVEPPIS